MRTSLLALLATILSCGDDITNNYYYSSDEGAGVESEAEAEAEAESESESEAEAEAESEGESKAESEAEGEAEAESESESEAEAEAEAEGEEVCASVTKVDGEVSGANGAPNFSLALTSPVGATIPGLGAVMRFFIAALPDCGDIVIDELRFRIDFTDNAASGWQPAGFMIINMASPDLGIPATTVERGPAVHLVTVSTYLYVPTGVSVMFEVRLDTTGASPMLDDTLLVILQNPVQWHVDESDSSILTTLEETLPIPGNTLTF